MKFSNFLNEKKSDVSFLDEAITPEQRKQYNELVDSANLIVKKLKSKLKVVPVEFDSGPFYLKIGTKSFAKEGIPAFSVDLKNRYGKKSDDLDISQSSKTFTKESLKEYSAMLKETYDNYDLILKSLNDFDDLKEEYRDLSSKVV